MKKAAIRIDFTAYFERFIGAAACGRRLALSGRRISAGTIGNYRFTQRLLVEYELQTQTRLSIQLLHRASLQTLAREKNYWTRFFKRFARFLYRRGYSDSYVHSHFKIIRSFFNYLQNEKGLSVGNFHKGFRVPLVHTAPVVLLPERLQYLIADKKFEAGLSLSLRRAKDIFVFGCTVALRVSDLMNLRKRDIEYTSQGAYLRVFTQKTGAAVKIPLPGYALDIIRRYKFSTGKYLLPRLSVTNLNIQLKKLVQKAGWNYPLTKLVSRQGRLVEQKTTGGKSWRFHEHITAHTMRRTAITTLLILGVPELVVRKISGHTPGSKAFYRYVDIAQDYLNLEVKKAQQKLLETDFWGGAEDL